MHPLIETLNEIAYKVDNGADYFSVKACGFGANGEASMQISKTAAAMQVLRHQRHAVLQCQVSHDLSTVFKILFNARFLIVPQSTFLVLRLVARKGVSNPFAVLALEDSYGISWLRYKTLNSFITDQG